MAQVYDKVSIYSGKLSAKDSYLCQNAKSPGFLPTLNVDN